jgi:hypothetical protein
MLTNKIFLKENKTTFESGMKSSTFMGPLSPFSLQILQPISSMWPSPIPHLAQPAYFFSFYFFSFSSSSWKHPQPAAIACYCLLLATTITSVPHLHLSVAPSRFFSHHRLSILTSFPVLARSLEPRKFSS